MPWNSLRALCSHGQRPCEPAQPMLALHPEQAHPHKRDAMLGRRCQMY